MEVDYYHNYTTNSPLSHSHTKQSHKIIRIIRIRFTLNVNLNVSQLYCKYCVLFY